MSEKEYVLFLTLEEVLEIHRDQIENYGGEKSKKEIAEFFKSYSKVVK